MRKKNLTPEEEEIMQNALEGIVEAGQALTIDGLADIYQEIMNLKGRDKVDMYLKFARFMFVEAPKSLKPESDYDRSLRQAKQVTQLFEKEEEVY